MGSYLLPVQPLANPKGYKLPSIHSLSLELPTLLSLPQSTIPNSGAHPQSMPQGTTSTSIPTGAHQGAQGAHSGAHPTLLLPRDQQAEYSPVSSPPRAPHYPQHYQYLPQHAHAHCGFAQLVNAAVASSSQLPSASSSQLPSTASTSASSPLARSRSHSDPPAPSPASESASDETVSPPSIPAPTPTSSTTTSSASTVAVARSAREDTWKPRKKRQCPECKLFFSNLATHKSTHLKPTSRPHICKYCHRGFARPNDLFRHVKCHWKEIGSDKGQFKCPFKNHPSGDYCCHSSGIFSRCDTFKNHLKAIHFQYPNGTKKDQRTKVPGECRMCHEHFANVDDWLSNHVEKTQCKFANQFKKN